MEENTQNIEQTESVTNQTEPSLEEKLTNLLDKWTENVKLLNDQMKNLQSVDTLLNEVYYKRQEAVDLYYGTSKILAKQTRDYKTKAAGIYTALKSGQAGLRFTNDSSINLQIETRLVSEKECIDILTNFTNFMKETISTIDNIIYGINSKIKIYEMINGLKF